MSLREKLPRLDLFYHPDGTPIGRSTVIVRTADNGEMGLAHGGLRQKAFGADGRLRSPRAAVLTRLAEPGGERSRSGSHSHRVDDGPPAAEVIDLLGEMRGAARSVPLLPIPDQDC
jgi:choline-sulfatase